MGGEPAKQHDLDDAPIDWVKVAIVVAIVLVILLVVLFVLSQADSSSGESLRPVLQYVAVMIRTPFDFAQGAAGPPLLLLGADVPERTNAPIYN